MNDETLLPCPFCGGAAVVVGERHDRGGFYITCSGVGCQCAYGECYDRDAMPDHQFAEAADAIASWNTRAQASAPDGSTNRDEISSKLVDAPEREGVPEKVMRDRAAWLKRFSDNGSYMNIESRASSGALFHLALEIESYIDTRSNAKAGEAVAAFVRFFEHNGEGLFAQFGMPAVDLYNAAAAELRSGQCSDAKTGEVESVYVECRQCDVCDHIGINDASATEGACHNCDWSGPEQVEDKCPKCGDTDCMAAACPECGSRYALLADTRIALSTQRGDGSEMGAANG